MTTLTIKLNFGTSRPFLRYRQEDGDWQLSNTFEVESGNGPYRFSAIDSIGCVARITIKEADLDFPDGNGTLTISKTVSGGESADDAVFFQFSVDGPVSFENILVSADEPMVLENLPYGTYTVTENDPPTGYLNSGTPKEVTLSESNDTGGAAFINYIEGAGAGTLTINKTIADGESSDNDTFFKFIVEGPVGFDNVLVSVNTPAVLENIPLGTYTIKEAPAPSGYLNNSSEKQVVLETGSESGSTSFENEIDPDGVPTGPGSLTVTKNVRFSAGEYSDTVFRVNVIGPYIAYGLAVTEDTPLELTSLPLGTYQLDEVTLPDNFFLISVTPDEVTLTSSNKSQSAEIENNHGGDHTATLTLNKVVTNEEPTFGDAVFRANVVGPETYYGLAVTINTPQSLTGLPFGIYSVEEVSLPDGFFLNAVTPDNPELTDGNPDWTVKIFNTFGKDNTGPGTMTIRKKVLKTKDEETEEVGDVSVLETGLAVDQTLHDTLTGVSMELLQAGSPVNIHTSGTESWEKGAVSHAWGGIMEDHQGNIRMYYLLRNINDENGRNAPALSKSTNGGASFSKVRENLNPTIINDSQSNIIKVPAPDGVSEDELDSFQVTYDPYGKTSERYKAVTQWQGESAVYASASEDGLTFGAPVEILDPSIGDGYYSGMFYDLENKTYVMYGRARGTNVPPAEGPPRPYGTRRYVIRAESLNWNDTPWETSDVTVIDPATEWGYDDNADSASFWDEVTDSCGTHWEPVGTGESRPNIYLGNARDYKGYYIGLFPVYFRHDDRVPYARPERTTGPIYPVLAISKDGSSWTFPDNDAPFLDLSIYNRTETNPCHSGAGDEEVGQVYSGFLFMRQGGKFLTAAMDRPDTHYEGGVSDFDHKDRRIDVFSMREDGFSRITGTGTWTTPNFVLNELTASMILNSAGQVDVEILDSGGSVITNFAKADFSTLNADNVENPCSWAGSLSDLAGQTIALKFYLDNASIYSYSFLSGEVAQNDELFTGDLQGEITIEGLQFSTNDPAEIQNLPLGVYLFEEDEKTGWLLKSIDPLETTLTEDQPHGEVVVTNEFGEDDPELSEDEIYITGQDGTGGDAKISKLQFDGVSITELASHVFTGGSSELNNNNRDCLVMSDGRVIAYHVRSGSLITGTVQLHLLDSDLNLLKSESIDEGDTSNGDQNYWTVRRGLDDNIYVAHGNGDHNIALRKYDSGLNLIWQSNNTFFEHSFGGSHMPSGRNVIPLVDRVILLSFTGSSGGETKLISYNISDGTIEETLDVTGPIAEDGYQYSLFFYKSNQFGVIKSDGSDEANDRIFIYDDALTLVKTIDPVNDLGAAWVGLTSSSGANMCGLNKDGKLIIPGTDYGSNSDSPVYIVDIENVSMEVMVVGGSNVSWRITNWMESGKYAFSDGDRIRVVEGAAVESSQAISSSIISDPNRGKMLYDNWQADLFGGKPPPPPGTATITVNKTIQDGEAADDDKEFTVNIYGPVNLLTRTVTANTPLVLEDLPFGEYTVFEETSYPGEYEKVSVTPKTFNLTEASPSQTVEIVNRKMDSDEEFVTGTLNIEDILEGPDPTDAFTEIEIQDTGLEPASGSITVKYKGVNVTLSYNEFMSPATVALALMGEIENDGSIELIATVPSSRILRLTEKTPGAAGNSSQTGSTVAVSFTNNTHISTPTDIFVLQGGSDPQPNFIEIYYPWDGDGFTLYPITPKVSILYAEDDTPAEVAEALRVATNAADINLTATRSTTSVTFTEKRPGPEHAGKVIRVITNGQTIQITPATGEITMA